MIRIRPVDENSIEACASLKCTDEQCRFANSPVWSLLQAAYTSVSEHCRMYAIYNDDEVVGMVRLDLILFEDCFMFTNLIIDKRYQRRHYAYDAVKCIFDLLRKDGRRNIVRLHVDPENEAAIALYEKSGFRYTGKTADGIFSEFEAEL